MKYEISKNGKLVELNESKEIKKMYKDAGLTPPDGKGEHTKKFHEMAVAIAKSYVKKGKSEKEAKEIGYATAMDKLGKDKALKK